MPAEFEPLDILQTLMRFDTTNPPANKHIPVAALEFGTKTILEATKRVP
jgi:hypothetical protein